MTNPLIADTLDTTSPFSGVYLVEDGRALAEAIQSGSWIDGGMASLTVLVDAAAAIIDPIGTLVANGLGWVLDHAEPLKGWMNDFTGDAGEVLAFARTWRNVAVRIDDNAEAFARRTHDLEDMSGAAIDAYLVFAGDAVAHLRATGSWAEAIARGLEMASELVQTVHDVIRDALAQLVGTAVSVAAEMALTVGLATPAAIAQISSRVSSLATRLGKTITKLLAAFKRLRGLLDSLNVLFDEGAGAIQGMLRGSRGGGTTPGSQGPNAPRKPQIEPRMAKPPVVIDSKLQSLIDAAFIREGYRSMIPGDGSLITAIRFEKRTGERVGGKNHVAKGTNVSNSLKNWLNNNPDADPSDRTTAERLMQEILDAINE